jgi:hypothetical protein
MDLVDVAYKIGLLVLVVLAIVWLLDDLGWVS